MENSIIIKVEKILDKQTFTSSKTGNVYEKFGFMNEGISESVHGGAVWYQMRLTFDEEYHYEHMFDISDNPYENKQMFEEAFWGSQC